MLGFKLAPALSSPFRYSFPFVGSFVLGALVGGAAVGDGEGALTVGHKLLNRLGGAAGHARNSPSFPPSHLRSQPSYSIEHWQGWHSKLAPMPRLAQLLQLFFVHGLHAKFFLSLATMQPLLLRASKYTSALPTCTHFCKIIVSTFILFWVT